jgi:hypothetical protein
MERVIHQHSESRAEPSGYLYMPMYRAILIEQLIQRVRTDQDPGEGAHSATPPLLL